MTEIFISSPFSGERGRVRGGHLGLEFGAYWGFGICDLGFRTIDALCYALYEFGEYGPQIS